MLCILLISISDSHQKYHNNAFLAFNTRGQLHSTLDDAFFTISTELFISVALYSHHNISPKPYPVIECSFAPLIGLIDEVDH